MPPKERSFFPIAEAGRSSIYLAQHDVESPAHFGWSDDHPLKWAQARHGAHPFRTSRCGTIRMQNSPELEQMANLLAMSADVMRRLASSQDSADVTSLSSLADELDDVAGKLVDLIYPPTGDKQ